MSFIWNLIQQSQIGRSRAEASTAKTDALHAQQSASDVRHEMGSRLDRLALVCQAMWELLRETQGVTEEMLIRKVSEIDLRDGKLDGKLVKNIRKCSDCGRVMNSRHTKCIYCGAENLLDSAFDQV